MKRNIITWLMLLGCITIWAQGVKPLPTLHVEGRWLVDKHGNQVVLHGVMDTPNSYFNEGYWHGIKTGSRQDSQGVWHDVWDDYNDTGVTNCLAYFEKLFDGMERAKCDVFRLHLDPAWTNDPSSSYVYSGSVGQSSEASGEADIKKFNPNRLTYFLPSLYLKLAEMAMNHGLYVVVRPPGVCPKELKVGDYYQQYLKTVWDIFTQQQFVKDHPGQLSIELANEPVSIKNASNQDDPKALHDYFQPIVDKIRENGFTGIIWVPGSGYQSNYRNYKTYPITDGNFGYAVHDYPGWYNSSDDNPDPQNKIANFHDAVPVVETNPVFITEVDWSPIKEPKEIDHYNEMGQPVYKNLGTWATGSTSQWGHAYKSMLDYFQNISMTLTHPHDFFDLDALVYQNKVEPAFNGNPEACAKACMDWYPVYFNVNWPHPDGEAETGPAYTIQSISAATGDIEMEEGDNLLVSLKAVYADGHTQEICDQATYTFDDPTIASANKGYIKGLSAGSTKVTATYSDKKGQQYQTTFNVTVNARDFFSFKQSDVISIWDNCSYNESTRAFTMAAYGQIGWKYPEGIDISGYKYLVVKLQQEQNIGGEIRIFPVNNIWGAGEYIKALSGKMTVVKLSEVTFDLSKVYIIDFWSRGGTIYVEDVYLTNNDDYSKQTTSINTFQRELENDAVYNLQGVKVGQWSMVNGQLKFGIYIIGGKKVVVR